MLKIRKSSGYTLVEVLISFIVASALVAGAVRVYVYGIQAFDKSTSKIQMLSEGTLALRKIESAVRRSESMYLVQGPNGTSSRVTLKIPDYGNIDYFYNTRDKTLRCSDHRTDNNNLNQLVLPQRLIRPQHGSTLIHPYDVKSISFKYGDEDYSGYYITDPSNTNYILKIEIKLEDDYGNEVTISSYQSRLN